MLSLAFCMFSLCGGVQLAATRRSSRSSSRSSTSSSSCKDYSKPFRNWNDGRGTAGTYEYRCDVKANFPVLEQCSSTIVDDTNFQDVLDTFTAQQLRWSSLECPETQADGADLLEQPTNPFCKLGCANNGLVYITDLSGFASGIVEISEDKTCSHRDVRANLGWLGPIGDRDTIVPLTTLAIDVTNCNWKEQSDGVLQMDLSFGKISSERGDIFDAIVEGILSSVPGISSSNQNLYFNNNEGFSVLSRGDLAFQCVATRIDFSEKVCSSSYY